MDSPQYTDSYVVEFWGNPVLNLIINGQSSILKEYFVMVYKRQSFKPYYKWIVLNTMFRENIVEENMGVLNLIINGQSSIRAIYLAIGKDKEKF